MNWQDVVVMLLVAASAVWLGRFGLRRGCACCPKRQAQKEPQRLIEISTPRKDVRGS
jgi:hypothetical protein